ncbi:MAG TPA: tRNA guanosine(15) transglycosylase TgtA [Nitrososphaerales archaeon]|nr:tRNA guanosine(15) transglycosylase TgtA [Nitrososphaerales archaeon]
MTKPISFEVKETDLMGRVGVMTVGKKSIETPCLTPVIHPVWRDIPPSQFKEMGFDALMTNSYILYQRKRSEALEKGLHDLIGFDGVLMTDSGGYQVLEYGDTAFTPEEIADFQSKIGSDLAVTLDKPTGYSISRSYARETMQVSLSAAKMTIDKFGESDTVWVGPVQGGIFGDLVRSSARGLVSAGFQVLALGSPVELMEGYLFSPLVEMIINAKKSMPYSMPLHLFGAGHPLTLPLSVALGCDTFDSASYMLYARKERYMTERGTLQLERMTYLPCSCPVCNGTTVGDLRASPRQDRVRKIALHNLHVLRADVLRCKEAIYEGRLWDLVEERAMAHTSSAAAFRALARDHSDWLVKPTRLMKLRGLMVRSEEDTLRPELTLARAHLRRLMVRRAGNAKKTAVLVPSSAGPPLTKTSGKMRRIRGLDKAHIFRINPQLGPYPAELEFVFPFAQTISDREGPEASVRACVRKLRGMGYAKVVVAGAAKRPRAKTRSE